MNKYKHSFTEPIGLALVRSVLPETFANKIFGVQPMKPPLSVVTTMPFRIENPIPEFDKIGERENFQEPTEEEKQIWKARP